jgi:hypothetical protein
MRCLRLRLNRLGYSHLSFPLISSLEGGRREYLLRALEATLQGFDVWVWGEGVPSNV